MSHLRRWCRSGPRCWCLRISGTRMAPMHLTIAGLGAEADLWIPVAGMPLLGEAQPGQQRPHPRKAADRRREGWHRSWRGREGWPHIARPARARGLPQKAAPVPRRAALDGLHGLHSQRHSQPHSADLRVKLHVLELLQKLAPPRSVHPAKEHDPLGASPLAASSPVRQPDSAHRSRRD